MTWKLNANTGELYDPNNNVVASLGEPPYKIPEDVQKWAESEFRSMTMEDIDTDTLADFAQLWIGDVEFKQ